MAPDHVFCKGYFTPPLLPAVRQLQGAARIDLRMQLEFRRGQASRPRGHGLIAFPASTAPDTWLATYVIVPPIQINLSKYVPPMLQAQLPVGNLQEVAAVPLPPVPEEVPSFAWLEAVAAAREDDLVVGPAVDPGRLDAVMAVANEAAQEYLRLCQAAPALRPNDPVAAMPAAPDEDLDAEVVVWELLTSRERLGEFARMTGEMRYAVAGNDTAQVERLRRRMERLGGMLPPSFRLDRLLAAVSLPGRDGDELARLYLERCYRILDEDYLALEGLDRAIRELESA